MADDDLKADWARVPKEVVVNPTNSREAYKQLLTDTPKAQLEDIPAILKKSFIIKGAKPSPQKPPTATDTLLGVQKRVVPTKPARKITVKEMQGLRSKLLEVQRASNADGKFNKARIAGDMADNLLEDMAKTEGSEALTIAIASTRKFKQRFNQGIVGKILGRAKTGEPAVSPDLTLDMSIGRGGKTGIKGTVDLDKVVVTPEARNATRRYLSRSFTRFRNRQGN